MDHMILRTLSLLHIQKKLVSLSFLQNEKIYKTKYVQ